MSKYIVAITGASGSIYGIRIAEELLKRNCDICLLVSDYGREVLKHETGFDIDNLIHHLKNFGDNLVTYGINDLFAPIASGSYEVDGMIIAPCSMATLSSIAHGMSKNLIERAADVCIKEKRKLIVVPRETPLSTIHLKNMLELSEIGVLIMPAMPAFYNKPKSIDDLVYFIVGRVLDNLNIKNDLYKKWDGGM